MPKRIDWRELAFALAEDDAHELLDSKPAARIVKANSNACTICADPTKHSMKYQLLRCKSEECLSAGSGVKCGWRGKSIDLHAHSKSYIVRNRQSFFDRELFAKSRVDAAAEALLSGSCWTPFETGPSPKCPTSEIWFGRSRPPRLRAVQNFVNYYSKTQLGYNDDHEDITRAVRDMDYDASNDDTTPTSFTYGKTDEGQLVIGDGSDEEPFVVGITTKRMLMRLDRNPDTFIFHIDATFKLSQVGYPVLVMGISDRARKFHLVAFCIISQRIESVYVMALASFRSRYTEVTGKQVRLKFVMGYAEDGQLNALERVFRHDSDFVFLMCFFHVMKKVQERTKYLPERMANAVLAHVYNIHFCTSFIELTQVTNYYMQHWGSQTELDVFAAYFKAQWLSARYSRWQCCYTAPGFATTNNPVEQFNRVIKRDYTLRARLKMGLLIKVLSECCANDSNETQVFHLNPEATTPLIRRAKQLAKDKLLQNGPQLFGNPNPSRVQVKSLPAPRFYIPSKKRSVEYLAVTAQMGWNYARMEYQNQPTDGWIVDISAGWCQCKYWRKFGSCIHLLHARFVSHRVDSRGKRILVNRSIVRKNGVGEYEAGATPAGRPLLNRESLSLE